MKLHFISTCFDSGLADQSLDTATMLYWLKLDTKSKPFFVCKCHYNCVMQLLVLLL